VKPSGTVTIEQAATMGGTEGNELLTSTVGALLTLLLAAEGVTIVDFGGLTVEHMFIGMLLIPPVLLKLASTGYRFVRYYTGSPQYRRKGPPALRLRLLAPLLVAATVAVFATGVWLLVLGHKSNTVVELHKVSFIVWGALFAVHFLAYAGHVVRSLGPDGRRTIAGSTTRAGLVVASLAAGVGLALSVLSLMHGWHG
jgi:hypothetical protein